jgi:hypothetical protein
MTRFRTTRSRISLLPALAALALVAATSAHASTVTGSGTGVTAAAGEQNNIVVSRSGNVTTITDTAGVSGGGLGCVPMGLNQVDCTSTGPIVSFSVLAGDRDDSVQLLR